MNIYTPWKSLEELYYGNPYPLEESIDESEEYDDESASEEEYEDESASEEEYDDDDEEVLWIMDGDVTYIIEGYDDESEEEYYSSEEESSDEDYSSDDD